MENGTNQSRLETAWRALDGQTRGETGFRLIHLERFNSISILAGRRAAGNEECVVFGIRGAVYETGEGVPKSQGFMFSRLEQEKLDTAYSWFVLSRTSQSALEIFLQMTSDLIDSLRDQGDRDSTQIYRILTGRIRAWQEFMKKSRIGRLRNEDEIGLFSEIYVLSAMIGSAGVSPKHALDGWVGPEGGIQDFILDEFALEVKGSASPGKFYANILGLDQLDNQINSPLYLAAVRIQVDDSGQTLPDLIDSFSLTLINQEHRNQFEEKLISAGYFASHRNLYVKKFSPTELHIYSIDDNSPVLTSRNVPDSVVKVKYALDVGLLNCVATSLSEFAEFLKERK